MAIGKHIAAITEKDTGSNKRCYNGKKKLLFFFFFARGQTTELIISVLQWTWWKSQSIFGFGVSVLMLSDKGSLWEGMGLWLGSVAFVGALGANMFQVCACVYVPHFSITKRMW